MNSEFQLTRQLTVLYNVLWFFFIHRSQKYVAMCKSGYRSIIGASILRAGGYDATDVFGGFASISVYNPEITTTKEVMNNNAQESKKNCMQYWHKF